jgi:hypothetical protein
VSNNKSGWKRITPVSSFHFYYDIDCEKMLACGVFLEYGLQGLSVL